MHLPWRAKGGEAHGGQQLPQFGVLPLRNGERLMVTLLAGRSMTYRIQQIASHSMQRSLAGPLVGRLDDLRSLGEAIQTLRRP
jgi:hypothetical protein